MIQTERLLLREMTAEDRKDLNEILQDTEVMYAYEHPFSDEEVTEWFDRQLRRYEEYEHKFGLWAVVLRETGEMIGQTGLTLQNCGEEQLLEIGYLFKKRHWHNGYATEAVIACKEYAFQTLKFPVVYSIIRENNLPSRRVAERNGMKPVKQVVKHYYGMDMPHIIYCVTNKE